MEHTDEADCQSALVIPPKSEQTDNLHTDIPTQYETMQSMMDGICEKLDKDCNKFSLEDARSWVNSLSQYISAHKRLIYASVTNHIFSFKDDTRIDNFLSNLQYILDNYNLIHSDDDDTYWIIIKFNDHANLAKRQYLLFNQDQKAIDDRIDNRIKEKVSPSITRIERGILSQLIGLVAIFTALSFIIFGGISSLDSIFKSLSISHRSVLYTIIVGCIWAFLIANLLFAFMQFIVKIIDNAKEDKLSTLSPKVRIQSHPLVLLYNRIILWVFLLCGLLVFAQKVGVTDIIIKYVSNSSFKVIIILVAICVVVFFLGFTFHRSYKQYKDKAN